MERGIGQPLLVGEQHFFVTIEAGTLQITLGSGSGDIMGTVATRAGWRLLTILLDTELAVYAVGIGLEDGPMTVAAWRAGLCIIGRPTLNRVGIVTIDAHGGHLIALAAQRGMDAAFVEFELVAVAGTAFFAPRTRISGRGVAIFAPGKMRGKIDICMAHAAAQCAVHRLGKGFTGNMQGKRLTAG